MASYYTPADGTEAVTVVKALQRLTGLTYDYMLEQVDASGAVTADLTPHLVKSDGTSSSSANVAHTSTDTDPGVLTFSIDAPLVWGADLVKPSMLISHPAYAGGQVQRFPLGVYVVSSPERTLKDTSTFTVTGYSKTYLLKSDVGDTFSALDGTVYADRVAQLLYQAGMTSARLSGHLNPAVVNFPADWAAKTVPSGTNMVWPSDDSNNFAYIDIINEILKASGCRPLYADRDGTFTVDQIPKPATQTTQWTFQRTPGPAYTTEDFASNEAILADGNLHANDLWNVPNQWVFIQQGLTFDPVEGSGQYTINNAPSDPTHYKVGSDQTTIGRVIRTVQHLSASGQADLVKQGEDIFTAQFAQAERVTLSTAPWPCAGHYDVFRYVDALLPRIGVRKLQAQSWVLPLDGQTPMTWNTVVVSDL